MHIVTRPRPEKITVKLPDGKVFEVTLDENGAHVPHDLGQYMVARGLVGLGHEPDPKPQWEMNGTAHGDLIPKYQRWVREVPPSDVDEPAQPEAVAAILGRKPRKGFE